MDGGGDTHVTEVTLAQAIVAAVRSVPGVADVSAGRFAEVATYGAREKVKGVIVRPTADGLDVEVHVCAHYADSLVLDELANRVREAARESVEAAGVTRVSHIDVAVDDLYVP
jgi:uncharacterized alkaline shock family protein YloU